MKSSVGLYYIEPLITISAKTFYLFSDKRYVPGVDCFVNGVPKSVSKTVKIFEISETQWPSHVQGVPKESEAFVRFMVHVSRWKRRSLYTDGTGINGKNDFNASIHLNYFN